MLSLNMAAALAKAGKRVGLVDMNLLTPSLHISLGIAAEQIGYTIQDYLAGICEAQHLPIDVTARLDEKLSGKLFFVAARSDISVQRLPREAYPAERLLEGYMALSDYAKLDILLIDCEAGLTEVTLPAVAAADMLLVVMRLDQHDYQGTGVAIDVATTLDVPDIGLVVNMVTSEHDPLEVARKIQDTYKRPVRAVLPHSRTALALAEREMVVLKAPEHPLAEGIVELTQYCLTMSKKTASNSAIDSSTLHQSARH